MKKFFVLTAFVIATALHVFTVAKSYEYMDVYFIKSGESPDRIITRDLYDKNDEDADEPYYYYAFGVESSSKSSYLVTQFQYDGGG